jgi:hypothetical protein
MPVQTPTSKIPRIASHPESVKESTKKSKKVTGSFVFFMAAKVVGFNLSYVTSAAIKCSKKGFAATMQQTIETLKGYITNPPNDKTWNFIR